MCLLYKGGGDGPGLGFIGPVKLIASQSPNKVVKHILKSTFEDPSGAPPSPAPTVPTPIDINKTAGDDEVHVGTSAVPPGPAPTVPTPIDVNKTSKDDDARIPVELWDAWVWNTRHSKSLRCAFLSKFLQCPLQTLQEWLLRVWRRRLTKETTAYLCWRGTSSLSELEAIRECIEKACLADWWDWKGGSRIHFWRWPQAHRGALRKGHQAYVKGPLPRYRKLQPNERNPEVRAKISAKLENVLLKGDIRPGKVKSLTGYFGVPKGLSDICMVYNASRSGLNDALWSPNFGLPTVETLLRGVEFGTWMGDIDLGEMFLNFCLDENLHAYCGVDLSPFCPASQRRTRWERWVRCLMGLKVSPYLRIKGLLLGLEWVLGETTSPSNVFHWERVCLNLPGSPDYNPQLPWVSKVKKDPQGQ